MSPSVIIQGTACSKISLTEAHGNLLCRRESHQHMELGIQVLLIPS